MDFTAVLRSNVYSGISYAKLGVRSKQCSGVRRVQYGASEKICCSHSLYDVLSVSPDVSERDIKTAYRRMALTYHPDVCSAFSDKEECNRMFLQVQKAYETLSDPLLRQDYDWTLQRQSTLELSESEGILESSNSSVWKAQVMELMRIRSSNNSSWGSRMRRRNQHMPTSTASK